jgi:uncharacterized protein
MGRITLIVVSLAIAGFFAWQVGLWTPNLDSNRSTISLSSSEVKRSSTGLSSSTGVAASLQLPKLTGRVVDGASMLSSAEISALNSQLAAFEAKSSDQVVVATLKSLQGNNLEDFANRLFRSWQLGQSSENNGVLLLVASDERKIRIEVGYGLEGILTDALSSLIINQVMVPNFRSGNFGQGIVEGTDMILQVLSGDLSELEARKKRQDNRVSDYSDVGVWIFLAIWGVCFFGPFGFALLAPIFGKKTGKKRYRWLGIDIVYSSSSGGGWSSGGSSSGGWSGGSSGGGFSGGGGSSGGGGASGGW